MAGNMKSSFTVFLCSTYTDLSSERTAVLEAVRKLQLHHDSMEFFGARSSLPIETCLEEVRNSDILVVIIGFKYGTLVPGLPISFSEAEYQEGYRLGKPCLIYLRDDNVPILPRYIERNAERLQALERFKDELKARHTVATFKEASDLAVSVAADLSRTVKAFEENIPSAGGGGRRKTDYPVLEEIKAMARRALEKRVSEQALLEAVGHAVKSLLAAEEGNRPVRVYLSYSTQDHYVVDKFISFLTSKNINILVDIQGLTTGEKWQERIKDVIKSADILIVFLSKNSIKSKWVQSEISYFMSLQINEPREYKIIPVRLDHTEIPALLRSVKYLDLRDQNIDRAIEELSVAIKNYL